MPEFIGVHLSERHPGVATVTLTREPTNALTRQAWRELAAAAAEVSRRTDIASVILFGGHEIFCAGDDMGELRTLDRAEAEAADRVRREAVDAIAAIPKPTVAAVNGVAAGVGMSFALAADIAVAGKSASFLQAFARIGLLPDGGSTWFLPRLVGDQRARALAMLAPQISAEQAKEWGLIWDVVDDADLMTTATGIARKLADGPTLALARIKDALGQASGNDLGRQLDVERDFQRELGRSEDFKEGVAAFLAKRKADFKGK